MPELTTSDSDQEFYDQERPKGPRLTRLKVNLSSPLIVKTKGGENMAGPGDIVGHFGKHDVMMSKDLYIVLFSQEKYDELVRKEMLKIRIARRFDDGLPPFSAAQISEEKADIEKTMQAARDGQPKEVDPNDLSARIQVVDSHNGPPTAHPDVYATIVPGPLLPIPEDAEEVDPPDPGGLDPATGATAGAPGTFTPSGGEVPADFAALSTLTASPTTAWASGEYVVLGDASEAHWNGSAWTVGRAPAAGGLLAQNPTQPSGFQFGKS